MRRWTPFRASLVPPAAIAALLALWQAAASAGGPHLFLPGPVDVWRDFLARLMAGSLVSDVAATLRRTLLGFFLGGVPAMALGLVVGWSRRARQAIDPLIASAHSVPKVALLPLLLMLFGAGEAPIVAVASVAAFFPIVINAAAGVRQIHPIHFESAQNCGARRRDVLLHVVLPGSLPMAFAGARLALNLALVLTIAAELVASSNGVGAMIWLAWQNLRIVDVFLGAIVASVLGAALSGSSALLARRMLRWIPSREASL